MAGKPRTLRARVVLAFAAFAIAVAAIFGLSTTVFLYSVEDEFFNALLSEEAVWLEQQHVPRMPWPSPRQPWMSVHETATTMPPDLREQLLSAPTRREFRGAEGRHYHLRALKAAATANSSMPAWLVGEVSNRLVVRPMRADLLQKWLVVELIILALAVSIALWIARRIASPLSELAERVLQVTPATMSAPIAIAGADREVAKVARAIDDMRSRIDAFVEREQSFTRDASHELRTPLSVFRSTTSQALNDPGLPPASRRLLELALQSAEQMERSIASLLALTREAATGAPATPSRILPVLEAVVLEQSGAIDARGLSLRLRVPHHATLQVDEDVLHLLLSNIVGNAVTHAAHGSIDVSFANHMLVVTNPVLPGSLPPEQRLGERGVKGDASSGSGLGLSIVQRLCDRAGLFVQWRTHAALFEVSIGDNAAAGQRSGKYTSVSISASATCGPTLM